MPGYNHYDNCACGWCFKLGQGRSSRLWDGTIPNTEVLLKEKNYRLGSFSSCFVNPNATCPVCGAAVFYYANSHGSRVYFDDLGKPWPKHGCTDRGRGPGRGYRIRIPDRTFPAMRRRKRWEIEEIVGLARRLSVDPREERRQKYAAGPSTVLRVTRAARRGRNSLIEGEELVGGEGERLYLTFEAANYVPEVGDLLSWDGASVSVPDLSIEGSENSFKAQLTDEAAFDAALAAS